MQRNDNSYFQAQRACDEFKKAVSLRDETAVKQLLKIKNPFFCFDELIKEDAIEDFKFLLQCGADPHCSVIGMMITESVIRYDRIPMIKLLLDYGLDPNLDVDPPFRFPTMITACSHGSSEMVDTLIRAGADITCSRSLNFAVLWENINAINVLFEHNACTDDVLMSALRQKKPKATKRLLQLGLKVDTSTFNDAKAFMEKTDDSEIKRILSDALNGVEPPEKLERVIIPKKYLPEEEPELIRKFLNAAKNGNIEEITRILNLGLDPNVKMPDDFE